MAEDDAKVVQVVYFVECVPVFDNSAYYQDTCSFGLKVWVVASEIQELSTKTGNPE